MFEQTKALCQHFLDMGIPCFDLIVYKDGIRRAKNPIKILHLFQMTAGMNYDMHTPKPEEYYSIPGNNTPTVETVNMFAKTPLEFDPGEGRKYSLCHDVLGCTGRGSVRREI